MTDRNERLARAMGWKRPSEEGRCDMCGWTFSPCTRTYCARPMIHDRADRVPSYDLEELLEHLLERGTVTLSLDKESALASFCYHKTGVGYECDGYHVSDAVTDLVLAVHDADAAWLGEYGCAPRSASTAPPTASPSTPSGGTRPSAWPTCSTATANEAMIRLHNHSPLPFRGWVRTTTDLELPPCVHWPSGQIAVRGEPVNGSGARFVDVFAVLHPGERVDLDPSAGSPGAAPMPFVPGAGFEGHYGRMHVEINGTMHAAKLSAATFDGSAVVAHAQVRHGVALVDVWLTQHPTDPGFVTGEVMVTASSTATSDLHYDLRVSLHWGDEVAINGAMTNLVCDRRFADGQAVALPVSFAWLRHLKDAASAWIVANGLIGASGLTGPLEHWGDPLTSPQATKLVMDRLSSVRTSLGSWAQCPLGPAPKSTQTGEQEDQCFRGSEVKQPGGVLPRYLAALGMSRRPCHHLEADGRLVDPANRPEWRVWDGRTHWHAGVSPDRLGKTANLSDGAASGWWGPDVEHWFFGTTAVAHRATGSHALQRQLQHQAMIYLGQWTATPGLSTSQPYAARAIGWEGIGVVRLWRELRDQALAQRVRARWLQRWEKVILPALRDKDVWDVRTNDPRLGTGDWWMPWQQAIGAYGLWMAGDAFGVDLAKSVAARGARVVVELAYDANLTASETLAIDGRRHSSGMFQYAWMPLAAATVLRHEPTHHKARQIRARGAALSWTDPAWS